MMEVPAESVESSLCLSPSYGSFGEEYQNTTLSPALSGPHTELSPAIIRTRDVRIESRPRVAFMYS